MLFLLLILLNSKITWSLLFVAFSAFVYWYYKHRIAPYLKLPTYLLFMDLKLLYAMLMGKETNGAPLMHYIFDRVFQRLSKFTTEGMCVLWITEPLLIVFGEEAVKLFSSDPTVIDKPRIYNAFKDFVDKSILISSGNEYKKQKKHLNPAFYPTMIKGTVPVINENAEILVRKLSELDGNPTHDLQDVLQDSAFRIFIESSLGMKTNKLEDDAEWQTLKKIILKLAAFVSYRFFCPWLRWDFVKSLSPYARESWKIRNDGYRIVEEVLDDLKKTLCRIKIDKSLSTLQTADSFHHRKSFGEFLIEQHLQDPSFTMEDVKAQLLALIAGAFNTISTTMYFCVFLLGLHPDVQERAYKEVSTLTEGDIQYEDLYKLKYLECVIKETLRLYPAVPIFGRHLKKEVTCGKYKVPKDTSIIFLPYLLHRNPEIYPDPEVFDPSRFIEGNAKIKPSNFMSFADGARSCPGRSYAMAEVKILLAYILRNFKVFSLDRREDIQLSFELTLKSLRPLKMRFIPR